MATVGYHASFEKTTKLLRFIISSQEYQEIVARNAIEENVQKLPYYVLARCPLCGAPYGGYIDNYSLYKWRSIRPHYGWVFGYETIECDHFTGVQSFLNLNGNFPTEINYLDCECGDIPIVMPELLLDEFHAGAVIHSLPICRVEDDAFTPRYSLYTVTYYSDAPWSARDRSYQLCHPDGVGEDAGPIPLFYSSERIIWEPVVGDLPYWVERGKLHWLDLDDPALPLKSGPANDFPYAGIQGFGGSYIYRKRPKPRWRWLDRHWHPDGEIRGYPLNELLARPSW